MTAATMTSVGVPASGTKWASDKVGGHCSGKPLRNHRPDTSQRFFMIASFAPTNSRLFFVDTFAHVTVQENGS